MSEHLLRIAMRAAGRLIVLGVLTRAEAAALIRWAWCKASFELLPAGATSGTAEAAAMKHAEATEHWCATCPEDQIPHRVTFETERCPVCRGAA